MSTPVEPAPPTIAELSEQLAAFTHAENTADGEWRKVVAAMLTLLAKASGPVQVNAKPSGGTNGQPATDATTSTESPGVSSV